MSGDARIGTSGLEREPARKGAGAEALGQYAHLLSTVEITSSYQRPPSPDQLAAWASVVPPGFQFTLKMPRRITEELRLAQGGARHLSAFLESAAELGPHQGPLLVQLPSSFRLDLKALTDFLHTVPRGPRLALEFRHPSWNTPSVLRLLSAHDAAMVIADEDEDAPAPRIDLTADFAYVRLRRENDASESFWEEWAARLAALTRRGIDVYAYVKHERRGVAVERARRLAALLRSEETSTFESPSLLS